MASSSSCVTDRLDDLARATLEVLHTEAPWHASRIADALEGRHVLVRLEVDAFVIGSTAGRLELTRGSVATGPQVRVRTTVACVLDLVDARAGIRDTLRDGRLKVFGAIADLRRAGGAFETLIHALVRAPSGPSLLTRLRALRGAPETGPPEVGPLEAGARGPRYEDT